MLLGARLCPRCWRSDTLFLRTASPLCFSARESQDCVLANALRHYIGDHSNTLARCFSSPRLFQSTVPWCGMTCYMERHYASLTCGVRLHCAWLYLLEVRIGKAASDCHGVRACVSATQSAYIGGLRCGSIQSGISAPG